MLGISTYGIISTDTMSWSSDGTKLLFRISSGTSIIPDTNGVDDDFVYDFNTDAIIPLNENSLETILVMATLDMHHFHLMAQW